MSGVTLQWARRLTGVSFVLLLIGVVSYYNAMPTMFDKLDPAQNHMLELAPGESGEVEFAAFGEYAALRLEGVEGADLRLIDLEGGEDAGSAPTGWDIARTGEDGATYVAVRVFRSSAAGDYTLHNDGSTTLWFVDDISAQAGLFTDPWFVVMMLGCCIGPIFGVIGLILALIGWGNRGKENAPVVLSNEGRLPTTDELYRQYHGIEEETEVDVPDPFADVGQTKARESVTQEESMKENPKPDWEWWDEG